LLASTAVGTLEFRTALEPVRNKRTHADYIQGWADSVDFFNKRIAIEEAVDDPRLGLAPTAGNQRQDVVENNSGGEENLAVSRKGRLFDLEYDKLVVAVGCYSQTFGVPGVKEHALFLKDVGDARRIRKRILACFENAALPTTSEQMRKYLLNFAIVGGGPTGIEFAAGKFSSVRRTFFTRTYRLTLVVTPPTELHDFVTEDLAKLYPDLTKHCHITVYDVAATVLPMFDESLGKYAMKHFAREGIQIKTSHHIQALCKGLPGLDNATMDVKDQHFCLTLDIKEEGEVGIGMAVWSTGLMMNPFIQNGLGTPQMLGLDAACLSDVESHQAVDAEWLVKRDPRSGGVVTDDRLRLIMEPKRTTTTTTQPSNDARATMKDVFALGDCAVVENVTYPATAQVASQKADWLARRLNRGDLAARPPFHWTNLGVMAYLGNWSAIFQTEKANVSGRAAWFLWRGAYLTKSVSWRNKVIFFGLFACGDGWFC
jgi:NADH dehydrogenase FAD-containing subunit